MFDLCHSHGRSAEAGGGTTAAAGPRAALGLRGAGHVAIFDLLQEVGGVADDEMLRVFNCGIGMVLVVSGEHEQDVLDRLRAQGERAYRIGTVEAKAPDDPPIEFGAPPTQA